MKLAPWMADEQALEAAGDAFLRGGWGLRGLVLAAERLVEAQITLSRRTSDALHQKQARKRVNLRSGRRQCWLLWRCRCRCSCCGCCGCCCEVVDLEVKKKLAEEPKKAKATTSNFSLSLSLSAGQE